MQPNRAFLYAAALNLAPLQRQRRPCLSARLEHLRTRLSPKYKGLLILEKAFRFLVPASSLSVTWNFVRALPEVVLLAPNSLRFVRLTLSVRRESTSERNLSQMIVDRELVRCDHLQEMIQLAPGKDTADKSPLRSR